jgi:8-oxo-dGTP diphosphatase
VSKQINVVGAVITAGGQLPEQRVYCVQRGPDGALPGMWEFPGGKIEPGESPREALVREIREELECEIAVGDEVTTTAHTYDFGVVHLSTFWCELLEGTPTLVEHADEAWVAPADLGRLDWAPADIPAVEIIQRVLRS